MTSNSQRKAVVSMCAALVVSAHTVADLVAISGLEERAVSAWLRAMRECRPRMVAISEWRADALGRHTVPAYRWAPGVADASKPAAKTRAQITADYRKRKAKETA